MDRLARLLEPEEAKYIDLQVTGQIVSEILPLLTTRQWYVTKYYFGIGTSHKSMAEIAKGMGITRQRVSQIKQEAIKVLREKWKHDHPYTIPENMGPGGCTGIILMDEEE